MNITHRSIWNAALGAWVAVSEITRACGKRNGGTVTLVLVGASVCTSVGAQTIIDGAVVTVPDTQSSPWNISDELWVGEHDHGTLTVSGGTVSNTYGTIAFFSSSTGTATVTGASSVWQNSATLAVSLRGNGTLTVLDGGTVRDTDGYIGFYDVSTGHAAVTGVNSTWTNNGNLFVGYGGKGTLSVAAGGSVSNTTGVIGYTGIGNATVTGVNSNWSNGAELFVGQWGSGTLTVADGGHVSVNSGAGPIYVANIAGSTGVLNIGAAVGSAAQAAGTIAAGEVQFGAGTGSLNFNHTDTAYTFGTRITGAGTLNHYAGTTILTGANTYTGATTISGGTLHAGAAGTLSSSSAFTLSDTAGATLDLNNFNQTIGSLSGGGATGGDITLGSGILTTGGNNSSTSYAGVISGSGGVTKQGSGTLTLTGANNYSGGTTVSAGTLQGSTTSLQGNITNNAAIVFDQASSGAYAGAISGSGSLAKTGAGNVNLTGTHTYTGATTISGGTLSVNGSIANSAVTVNSGGTLGGSGTIGSTSITSGGLLAPGNSIGTLTVNGNLNFAAGSIYRAEVDAVGNNDRINVTGTATLNGGTVDVQAGAGTYAANTTYTLLNAAGGRTGNFSGVTSNLAFLTPTLAYDANNVFLSLARNDTSFSAVAITPNQIATSTALQNAHAGATGDMSVVQTALTGLSVEQARAAWALSAAQAAHKQVHSQAALSCWPPTTLCPT
jgi:T5SS/PEP-CTERM-associated repeat protein/autotransporter-associated beta strand protein